ncbi:LytR/AlgR family response regulator transcription factor [Chryseosolibacter indicus]|uniref:LytTR family DNA-binding domain-containing protein n=1 Tax=Chryseosolibacter indicus TaxID=2782351 RepID=A0ABS5VQK6_9BACT|nr:LytTR family DNA-binding domain-containing protein [Chryseosolibacter indicus]MBT1703626.1 LytTR family DNA-binding domain-containing protein [Chryseosolibacter indicus]
MIRCVVVDDEPLARKLLGDFIEKTPVLKLEGIFSSALKSLELLNTKQIDVLFLDIQMPDITGIDFLKTLKKKPYVVFTTAYAEFALEGFELDVVDYLLKPFDFNRFLKSVNKITQRVESTITSIQATEKKTEQAVPIIFVKDGSKLVKIELDSVLFIKGTREYATIHTTDKKIMTLQTLKSLEEELPDNFIRVHNSYIIYIPAINTVSRNEIEIGGEVIPIGISYKKQFFEKLKSFFPGKDFNG